jgi:uncharacterized protein (DUF305 family)
MKPTITLLLTLVLILFLAACAGPAASPTPTIVPEATEALAVSPTETPASEPTPGMDHNMDGGMNGDAPFDAMFIDGMTEHHQGAITMAEQALAESERPELRDLAEAIIAAQTTEIAQMAEWRQAWYPDLAPTEGMDMGMGDMEVSSDTSIPFDQRFIDAMISHHQGAIDMANEALANAEHEEIKTLAQDIITAQEAEIAQMQAWRSEWFGN